MKTIHFVLLTSLLAVLVSGCQAAPQATEPALEKAAPTPESNPLLPRPGEKSMKGFELYSWQVGDQWVFALLVGTNREKTLAEIQATDVRLDGLDELQAVLTSIPAGEYVTWLSRDSLAFPPEEIIQQVQEICAKQGLELGIAR